MMVLQSEAPRDWNILFAGTPSWFPEKGPRMKVGWKEIAGFIIKFINFGCKTIYDVFNWINNWRICSSMRMMFEILQEYEFLNTFCNITDYKHSEMHPQYMHSIHHTYLVTKHQWNISWILPGTQKSSTPPPFLISVFLSASQIKFPRQSSSVSQSPWYASHGDEWVQPVIPLSHSVFAEHSHTAF